MEPADGNSLAGNTQFIALDKIDFFDSDDKGFVLFLASPEAVCPLITVLL